MNLLFQENVKENVVCEISPILYSYQFADKLCYTTAGIILSMRPVNERRRYNVTTSLIG